MGIEIERKFTVSRLPENLQQYPCHIIEQGYLNVSPAIRVRRQDDGYYMTYKGLRKEITGDIDAPIGQTEYNLPLDENSYNHLLAKADGNVIRKKRYIIPLNENAFEEQALLLDNELSKALAAGDIKIELDIFEEPFDGRILAEVEFPSEEAARAYRPAPWFEKEVTGDPKYSNAHMSAEVLGISNSAKS
jgi:CYTH domain-containing protein